MSFVITPPPVATLPVRDDERRFPVHRIYCVGRNYAAHAVEMGHDPDKEPPFFFQKNPGQPRAWTARFPYPLGEPATCTTRSSWWWRWQRRHRHPAAQARWTTSSATPSAST